MKGTGGHKIDMTKELLPPSDALPSGSRTRKLSVPCALCAPRVKKVDVCFTLFNARRAELFLREALGGMNCSIHCSIHCSILVLHASGGVFEGRLKQNELFNTLFNTPSHPPRRRFCRKP